MEFNGHVHVFFCCLLFLNIIRVPNFVESMEQSIRNTNTYPDSSDFTDSSDCDS
jgi:hypothetical protein